MGKIETIESSKAVMLRYSMGAKATAKRSAISHLSHDQPPLAEAGKSVYQKAPRRQAEVFFDRLQPSPLIPPLEVSSQNDPHTHTSSRS